MSVCVCDLPRDRNVISDENDFYRSITRQEKTSPRRRKKVENKRKTEQISFQMKINRKNGSLRGKFIKLYDHYDFFLLFSLFYLVLVGQVTRVRYTR